MRLPFVLCLPLAACTADPLVYTNPPPPDGGAADAGDGSDVSTVDVTDDRPAPVDQGAPDTGVDAGSPMDVQRVDAGSDAGATDVDPRQSEVCRAVNADCDGRRVNVQTGERDGGVTYHCGGCGITCAAGFGCGSCVCIPLS